MADLTTVKGDKEIAEELREKLIEALKPVAKLINEANKLGFEVGFQFGPNPYGNVDVQAVNLMKKY